MNARDRRRLLLGLLAAAAGQALPARAQGFDLQALMQGMAARKSGQARFTEERIVHGIEGPLTSSGTLAFTAPDRFERHTLHPMKESMILEGQSLVLRRGDRTRRTELDAIPELGALMSALRATLGGDAAQLQKHFRATLAGTESRWVLRLVPLDAGLARQLSQIEIVGRASDLHSIALQMQGGDRSLMLIEPLDSPSRAAQ